MTMDIPMSFVKLFDSRRQAEIIKLVNEIKENAVEGTYVWPFFVFLPEHRTSKNNEQNVKRQTCYSDNKHDMI